MSLEVISVIDIDPSQPYISVVHCKQYDTVRVVEAHLYTDGVKWHVPANNIYAMVQYRKTDHIGGFYDIVDDPSEAGGKRTAVSIDSNDRSVIYISIAQEVLTTFTPSDSDGTTVEVVFYDTITNARLGLFYFHLKVEEASIREVDLASNPYFNILAEQIKAVLEAEIKLTGLTADAETLAPDDDATAVVSGGTGADDPYKITFGIPSMPGITVEASQLSPSASPTATISGGTTAGEDYHIAFGIPKGDKGDTNTIASVAYSYALSTNGTSPPQSGWSNNPSWSTDDRKGKFIWIRGIYTWSVGGTTTFYTVAYNGADASGAVISINGRDGTVTLTPKDVSTVIGTVTVNE